MAWAAATDYTRTNSNLTAERTGAAGFWGVCFGDTAAAIAAYIYNIAAMGSGATANIYVGVGLLDVTTYPGQAPGQDGVGWGSTGGIKLDGVEIATTSGWTTGNAPEIRQNGKDFTFWLDGAQQTITSTQGLGTPATIDISAGTYGYGNWTAVAAGAYPIISCGNTATGYKVTLG